MASAMPGLLSLPRITTLVASVLVALGSGTNYVFSAYAPQLAARLHITHTRLNIVGLAGNIGVYSSGPFLGRLVDVRGPRQIFVGAFVLLLVGYMGIRTIFDLGSSASGSTATFWLLVLCAFMTGFGGNGGLVSSVNATANSFPDRARATATGIVLSGFGLSAFFFSTISHTIYRGNTSSFLLLLALGTSFPMVIGFFLVRRIPLPAYEVLSGSEYGIVDEAALGDPEESLSENSAHTPLLTGQVASMIDPSIPTRDRGGAGNSLELSPTRDAANPSRRSRSNVHQPSFASATRMIDVDPNIHGKQLLASVDFWVAFILVSLLSGTGVMYINNVGSISQALFAKSNPEYDEGVASQWQAMQVSAISITNFSGRIIIGIVSDFTKNRLNLPRSYCISLVCTLFIISQLMVIATEDVTKLWRASLALGLAYGGLFGLFPTIAIEWFGLTHFSENWGIVCLSSLLGGNLFSIAFGRNLDAHAPSVIEDSTASPLPSAPSEPQCLEGRECYVASLYITTAACCAALALGVWAAWRDRKRAAALESRVRTPAQEWDEEG